MQTTINGNAEKMRSEYNSTLWKGRSLRQRRAAANTEGFRNWGAAQRRAANGQEMAWHRKGRSQAKTTSHCRAPDRQTIAYARAKQR